MFFSHKNLFVATFILLAFVNVISTARAQEGSGITIIPASIEKPADPGTTLNETLKVTNESQEEREYYIYKRDIKGVEEGGVPVFAEEGAEKTGYEMSEWIALPSDKIKIGAQQSVEIPVVLNIPQEATPGSHFAGVFVSLEPPRLREMGAGVGYEIASVFSIRISGDIDDSARIRSLSTDKLVYSSKKVEFVARVENQGNILIRPRGPLTITSMFGKKEVVTVNDNLAGVFPKSARDLKFTWESEGTGFGKYEAVLALVYDGEDGQRTIDATHTFWVFPTKILLSVLGGFLLIFMLGYALTKYYIRQAVMRASGGKRVVSQRYRKQVGVSRFAFVFVSVMTVIVIFLIIMLILIA
ncbi:MAG TPA: hypothetical protein VFV22_00505 [Candidatus Paceibacterota bacterium]|nr:hypothetical protein [Candidatus Paceibacterota bacterium]